MTDAKGSRSIFISHTHSDKEIADAFKDAVTELFGNYVTVSYSTNAEHGPKLGARWLQWIEQQVKSSDFALILLTPAALQKPWILWEAGAVAGTTVSEMEDKRKVRPLVFRVPPDQVPDPFRDIQVARGDNYSDMENVFVEWMGDLPSPIGARAGMRLKAVLEKYLKVVEDALDKAPFIAVEPVVQEWSLRLDQLGAQRRMSEVKTLHDWLNIAFGRDKEDKPLDVRLHRRLGELYLQAKNYRSAAEQFELARQSSPRDILILRDLGRAYLVLAENKDEKAADDIQKVIQAIEKLDPKAFERNVECAALKGRWLSQRDPKGAREVYSKAFLANEHSYYLGDLLGQMNLELGEMDSARNTYRKVLEIINAIGEKNLWVQATAANAAIVAGADPSVVRAKLEGIREFKPTPEELRSIERGLRRIQKSLAINEATANEWLAALRQ